MAKVKKFATGGISSLGSMLPSIISNSLPSTGGSTNSLTGLSPVNSGGGGGSAQDGLSQIDSGAGTVRGAINVASQALGGSGGNVNPPAGTLEFKKGGSVDHEHIKKHKEGGYIKSVSKNKKSPSW